MIAPGSLVAVTGATGFVGAHLVDALLARGFAVRALTRTPRPDRPGLAWVPGDLANLSALRRLVEGAAATIHLAGAIKGLGPEDFDLVNVTGVASVIAALQATGGRRLVHVSTLAARAPHLSDYARSKAAGEVLVQGSRLDWTIIRPPGVYGPGDRETLTFFQMATRPLALAPLPEQKLAIIHANDLAAALIAASADSMIGQLAEASDESGLTLERLMALLRAALGRPGRLIGLPRPLLALAAQIAQARAQLTGQAHILSPGKVAELYHPDWSVTDRTLQQRTGWRPQIGPEQGLAETAAWYRGQGWL